MKKITSAKNGKKQTHKLQEVCKIYHLLRSSVVIEHIFSNKNSLAIESRDIVRYIDLHVAGFARRFPSLFYRAHRVARNIAVGISLR